MAYLGNSPQQNIRQRYYYNATAGQTVFSGNDITGINLKYQDGKYLDVYVNGALLQNEEDYTAIDKSSVVLSSSLGGTFSNNIVVDGTLSVSGNVGIGTSNPQYKLDVAGDARITGNLTVAGSLTTTSNVVSFGSAFKIEANGDVFIFGTLNMLN